ncbi:hypothetical protein BQ8420_14030 [Nocardiopsis sp. JB363]|nr:hypothetical protein BQ8420_14030 [Nocardiopsis sp. JB363]
METRPRTHRWDARSRLPPPLPGPVDRASAQVMVGARRRRSVRGDRTFGEFRLTRR